MFGGLAPSKHNEGEGEFDFLNMFEG